MIAQVVGYLFAFCLTLSKHLFPRGNLCSAFWWTNYTTSTLPSWLKAFLPSHLFKFSFVGRYKCQHNKASDFYLPVSSLHLQHAMTYLFFISYLFLLTSAYLQVQRSAEAHSGV